MKNLGTRWRISALGRSLKVLPRNDQHKIIAVTLLQICMGALDLLGVAAIGLLGGALIGILIALGKMVAQRLRVDMNSAGQ